MVIMTRLNVVLTGNRNMDITYFVDYCGRRANECDIVSRLGVGKRAKGVPIYYAYRSKESRTYIVIL